MHARFGQNRQHLVGAMSLSTMRHININHALHSPSKEQLTTLLSILCSDGRLWKFGSCFVDQLDTRPFSKVHYNPTWFDTKDAMCVAHGITTKELAAVLETAGIQHLKYTLHVGVNVKDQDDVPHDHISAARPQALYIRAHRAHHHDAGAVQGGSSLPAQAQEPRRADS